MMNIFLSKKLLHYVLAKVYNVLKMVKDFLWCLKRNLQENKLVMKLVDNASYIQLAQEDCQLLQNKTKLL